MDLVPYLKARIHMRKPKMKEIIEKVRMYGIKKSFVFFIYELRYFFREVTLGSYSQNGEDCIIYSLLNEKKHGFYIDVGANDPTRFSNTKKFYKLGWRGINIEPNSQKFSLFLKERKEDINLNIGIGTQTGFLDFYEFFPDTLSTFSLADAAKYRESGFILKKIEKISVLPLARVIDEYCKNGTIDFLSIDTEGFDLEVLISNNWENCKPTVICIESTFHEVGGKNSKNENEIHAFLLKHGYRLFKDNNLNSIYVQDTGIL